MPYSADDAQSVVEIASFMVETKINLDGRYDQNRGLQDNTFVNQSNFNLINKVYGQDNNFFQYMMLDPEKFTTKNFPTRFTWSLNKTNGQDIDEWTRTNTAAFYDCDGDKGAITSIRRFGNRLLAFQEKGVSVIKYNDRVALSAENGAPVELGNSARVDGVEYISETIGSQNKWSCASTPMGVFFVDNNTPGIYRLGGSEGSLIQSLTANTMQRWFETNNKPWFITDVSYDRTINDVVFSYETDDGPGESLVFNAGPGYGMFTSFYDYHGVIGNIGGHAYNINNNSLWFLREGNDYNKFYGADASKYWIQFIANANRDGVPEPNCVYDNVWYSADVLHTNNISHPNYNESIPEIQQYNVYDFINNK